MTSTSASLTRQFAKPLVSGAVSAVTMRMLFGDKSFYVGGTKIGILPFGFGMGAVGCFVAQLGTNWVLSHTIGKDPKALQIESMVLSLGISAAYFVAVPKILNGDVDEHDMLKLAGAGAISEVVASYAYTHLIAGKGALLGAPY